MAGVRFEAFGAEHLDAAAGLLAARHERHRAAEPLLPELADPRWELEREWDGGEASGVAALDGDGLAGYLIGRRRDDPVGQHLWSFVAGHAVREPELVRDLYRAASGRWVEEGLTRHFFYVPALPELVEPWFRLSFGASAALATRETAGAPPVTGDVTVRPGTPGDLERSAALDRVLGEHLAAPPSFGGHPVPLPGAYLDDWRDVWDDERFAHFVAERNGAVVGQALLYRRPPDLRVPADAIDLANAATDPDARGTGVAVALTSHVLRWAEEHGYPTMVTDWRMSNLEASRFWPRRGFRETFLRVYRSIP
jgi:ribosomal protein S18 acetylase RimI-like enzyme